MTMRGFDFSYTPDDENKDRLPITMEGIHKVLDWAAQPIQTELEDPSFLNDVHISHTVMNPISTINRMNLGRLYEQHIIAILAMVQQIVNEGPLKDMVNVNAISMKDENYDIIYTTHKSFRAKNRVKAYRGYLNQIKTFSKQKLAELYSYGD